MSQQKKKHPGGRPPFQPTERDIKQVRQLAAMGIQHEHIAELVGITKPTLYKHFRAELDIAAAEANAAVAASLFRQATDQDKPNIVAAIFWLKSRAGWKEAGAEDKGKGKKQAQAEQADEVSKKFESIAPPALRLVK